MRKGGVSEAGAQGTSKAWYFFLLLNRGGAYTGVIGYNFKKSVCVLSIW